MSFHVYVEPDLERKIEDLCKKTGRKRNAIVREALKEFVEKHSSESWPESVFDFKPSSKLTRFESLRADFLAEREEVFAGEDL